MVARLIIDSIKFLLIKTSIFKSKGELGKEMET